VALVVARALRAFRSLRRWHEIDATVDAVFLVVRPRGEEQRVGLLIHNSIAELDTPETVDDQRLSIRRLQLSLEFSGLRIERVDRPVAEIADENVIAELSEALRRERDSPRRVEVLLAVQARQQDAIGIENTDKTEPGSVRLIIVVRLCFRPGDVEV